MSVPALAPTGLPPTADPTLDGVVAARQGDLAVLTGATLGAVLGVWATLDLADAVLSWASGLSEEVFVLIAEAQEEAAAGARDYVVDVLLAQGIVPVVPQVEPLAFAARASDGRPLDTLLVGPVVYTQGALLSGESDAAARAHGAEFLTRIVQVQIADAAREATQVAITGTDALGVDLDDLRDASDYGDLERLIERERLEQEAERRLLEDLRRILDEAAAREVVRDAERIARRAARAAERALANQPRKAPVVGWIRVLTPPSCGRCAVLAGKWYGWNEGFLRHDNCDCIHLPTTVVAARGLTVDIDAYFESLPQARQDELFGAATAQAIRDGADPAEVINATTRDGAMYYAAGRQFTREGATRRGGYRREAPAGRRREARPTPLQLYRDAAGNREEARRLLREYGYITSAAPITP